MDKRVKNDRKRKILKTLTHGMNKDHCILLNGTLLLSYDEVQLYKINVNGLRSIKVIDGMQEVFSIYL